jgi:quercetin dioxygenase-like cupin family protein
MGSLIKMNFDKPEEVHVGAGPVGRATFEPGWKWSTHVKPIAGTDSCMAAHSGYFISGRMKVVMDNGEEAEFGPGDVMVCPPGHDAWTVGDEACVVIDWQGVSDYAKRP